MVNDFPRDIPPADSKQSFMLGNTERARSATMRLAACYRVGGMPCSNYTDVSLLVLQLNDDGF